MSMLLVIRLIVVLLIEMVVNRLRVWLCLCFLGMFMVSSVRMVGVASAVLSFCIVWEVMSYFFVVVRLFMNEVVVKMSMLVRKMWWWLNRLLVWVLSSSRFLKVSV